MTKLLGESIGQEIKYHVELMYKYPNAGTNFTLGCWDKYWRNLRDWLLRPVVINVRTVLENEIRLPLWWRK